MRRFRNFKQKDIRHEGVRLLYEVDDLKSDKPVLIFIHGLTGDLTCWDEERKYFHDLGYPTLAMDLRGHGMSDRPRRKDDYTLDIFASDIHAMIENEHIKDFILIGHCFGGMITLAFEGIYKSISKALILIDTSYKPAVLANHETARILLNNILTACATVLPSIHVDGYAEITDEYYREWDIKSIVKGIMHLSLKNYLFIFELLIGLDLKKILKEIKIPTLVITGTDDTVFPPYISEEIHEQIKTSQLDYIEGANHILVLNNPEELAISIHQFLKNIKS